MFQRMDKRKNNSNNHIEGNSISSTPTDDKDNESISSYEDDEFKNKKIIINKYYGNITKSVFEIKDFILNKENFLDWYEPLKKHLIANDLDFYIENEFQFSKMNRSQIKSDNAVQSIILNSLEKSNKEYLHGCKTAYSMTDRLKKRFYQSDQALLNILENKIINLKLINNDYIQYVNDLNDLFEQHKNECNKLKRVSLDEETKFLYAVNELDKLV